MSCKVTTPPEGGAEGTCTLELYAGQPPVTCALIPPSNPAAPALLGCAGAGR